jgi:hypothetical protein
MRLSAAFVLVLALGCSATSPRDNGHDAATNAGADGTAGSTPASDGPATSDAAGHAAVKDDAGTESAPADAAMDVGGATDAGATTDAGTTTDAGGATDGGDGGAGASPWPIVVDYGAPGPFTIACDVNTGPGGAYDVFRPAMLGGANRRNPIVSWANGTLFPLADYQKLLEHWASHGLVVIAGHTNTTAGGGTHKAAIDWLVAESARPASPYFGVLDTLHVAAAGHSQGGGATIAAGAQKPGPLALTTTLPLMPILSFESDTSIVGKQTAPMFNINATMDTRDPTGAVAMQIYTAAKTELVQAAFIGIHEDAWMSAAMLAPTLAWFRFKLMGDAQARPLFYPAGTCGLCRDPAWKQVRYQNVP